MNRFVKTKSMNVVPNELYLISAMIMLNILLIIVIFNINSITHMDIYTYLSCDTSYFLFMKVQLISSNLSLLGFYCSFKYWY